MSAWSRLNRGETTIDFVGKRKRWFTISAVLLLLSVASFAVRGLNLGLEFEGGLGIQSPNPAGADVGEIRDALEGVGVDDATIQMLDDGEAVRITTEELDSEILSAAVDVVMLLRPRALSRKNAIKEPEKRGVVPTECCRNIYVYSLAISSSSTRTPLQSFGCKNTTGRP